jgi:hypothetical protein
MLAPIAAFAPVERPLLLLDEIGRVADGDPGLDVLEEVVVFTELVIAVGLTFVCTPCALRKTPCPC